MKNNPSALSGYYRSDEAMPHTLRMQVELTEPVDPKALKQAAKKAMERYDYFAIEIIKEENEPLHSIIPNSRDIVIHEGKEPVKLLSEQSNRHAIALGYENNTIYVDLLHSIADATSLFEWIKTLLYYYLIETTGQKLNPDDIRTLDNPVSDQERLDPFLSIEPASEEKKEGSDTARALQSLDRAMAYEELLDTRESKEAIRFSIDEKQMMDYVKKLDSTPAVVLANLFAKALFSLADHPQHPIRIVLMKNYREALGFPEAHHNITGNIALNYEPEMKDLDITELIAATTPMIKAQSSDGYALGSIQKRMASEQKLFENPDLAAIRARMQAQNRAMNKMLNLTLSYIHLAVPQALKPYIKSLYTTVDPAGSNVLVETAALQDRFFFSILQNFQSEALKEAFFDQLAQAGLDVVEEEPQPLLYASMETAS